MDGKTSAEKKAYRKPTLQKRGQLQEVTEFCSLSTGVIEPS